MKKNKIIVLSAVFMSALSLLRLNAESYMIIDSNCAEKEDIQNIFDKHQWTELESGESWKIYSSNNFKDKFFALGIVEDDRFSYGVLYDLTEISSKVIGLREELKFDVAGKVSTKKESTIVVEWEEGFDREKLIKTFDGVGKREFLVLSIHLDMILIASDLSYLNLPVFRNSVIDFKLPPVKGVFTLNELGVSEKLTGPDN